jgi:hypothetical protein
MRPNRVLFPRPVEDIKAEYLRRRREVLWRSLELSQAPLARNCVHHHQQEVGFCMWGSSGASLEEDSWPGDLCEGDERAPFCPYFQPKLKPLQVLEKTVEFLADPVFLREAYPDLAALGWALGMDEYDQDLSWWMRWRASLREVWLGFSGRAYLPSEHLTAASLFPVPVDQFEDAAGLLKGVPRPLDEEDSEP